MLLCSPQSILDQDFEQAQQKYSVHFFEDSYIILVPQLADQNLSIILLYPLRCAFNYFSKLIHEVGECFGSQNLGNNTKVTISIFQITFSDASVNKTTSRVLIFRIFPFVMNQMIISLSYFKTSAKTNFNYISKQISSICNSVFYLMVHTINFGLGMSSIYLASFVKVVLYFSRYSLFE